MPPNNPLPPPNPAPPASNNYEFIMNNRPPAKKVNLSFGGGNGPSLKKRLLLGLAGVTVLLIIIIAGANFILGGEDATASLVTVATEQQEIIRIADLGLAGTGTPDTINYVQTIKSSVVSSQLQVLALLKTARKAPKPAVLATGKDSRVDSLLAAASQAGNYNTVLTDTLNSRLNTYQTKLKATFDISSKQTTKTMLATAYTSTKLILNPK